MTSRLAVAATVSSNAFYERLMEAGAEVDLREQAINRTTSDVVARQDSLLAITRLKAPHIENTLKKAIDNGDNAKIGALLTSTPELEQYITPGMGWEGKAVTSQDQDKVLQFLRSNLKPKERRRAMMQFAQSLDIPQEMLTGENPKTKETIVNYSKVKKIN